MFAAQLFLFIAIVGLLGALNAIRPPSNDRHPMLRPPWLFSMLTAELIPIRIALRLVVAAVLIMAGALDHFEGRLAVWLTMATWAVYGFLIVRSFQSGRTTRNAMARVNIGTDAPLQVDIPAMLIGYPFTTPPDVDRIDDVEYAPGLHLDIYRGTTDGAAPALLQVHGGGWRGGNRRQQARPLMHHMARNGWSCVAVSYPLVPEATFPDQLVALKRAVVWLQTDGAGHGIDPDRVVVTGGSAGGHLGALLALTANRPEYQPGFEAADTSVAGAVTLYGTYDFLNRNGTRDDWPVIPRGVMKASPADAEPAYRAASPLDQVHANAPPFLVIHGSHDSLVSKDESAQFARALERVSVAPVVYAEIPGATHAFDAIPSIRTQLLANEIQAFADHVVGR